MARASSARLGRFPLVVHTPSNRTLSNLTQQQADLTSPHNVQHNLLLR